MGWTAYVRRNGRWVWAGCVSGGSEEGAKQKAREWAAKLRDVTPMMLCRNGRNFLSRGPMVLMLPPRRRTKAEYYLYAPKYGR